MPLHWASSWTSTPLTPNWGDNGTRKTSRESAHVPHGMTESRFAFVAFVGAERLLRTCSSMHWPPPQAVTWSTSSTPFPCAWAQQNSLPKWAPTSGHMFCRQVFLNCFTPFRKRLSPSPSLQLQDRDNPRPAFPRFRGADAKSTSMSLLSLGLRVSRMSASLVKLVGDVSRCIPLCHLRYFGLFVNGSHLRRHWEFSVAKDPGRHRAGLLHDACSLCLSVE